MIGSWVSCLAALLLLACTQVSAYIRFAPRHVARPFHFPATGLKTIVTPSNVTIRYKEPGREGVCETTPDVNSYSGYIDIAPNLHTFFWFFESRHDPANDPITMWIDGGPGGDSMGTLFQGLGPCRVTPDMTTEINPWSWNNVSNLLFISQPVGVGFSYERFGNGSFHPITGEFLNGTRARPTGTFPIVNPEGVDHTEFAAVAAWHIVQGFFSGLPQLDSKVTSKWFSLWTESYGGHWGPAFFHYFHDQNEKIKAGNVTGIALDLRSVGIGNGLIDAYTQAPFYPEFAVNNTYGIKAVSNDTYDYMMDSLYLQNGCLDQIGRCRTMSRSTTGEADVCAEAQAMCRDTVEGPYYYTSGRSAYDIRVAADWVPDTPDYTAYLNQAHVQNALGVSLNYTGMNEEIFNQFAQSGDGVYGDYTNDIEFLLNEGVRVHLYYGDADYICNWMGGEAVSLAVSHEQAQYFRAAGYEPFKILGQEYGVVRQHGNFSFLRMYDAGHSVPFSQNIASVFMFFRVLWGGAVSDETWGVESRNYSTTGDAHATHTQSAPPLATKTPGPDQPVSDPNRPGGELASNSTGLIGTNTTVGAPALQRRQMHDGSQTEKAMRKARLRKQGLTFDEYGNRIDNPEVRIFLRWLWSGLGVAAFIVTAWVWITAHRPMAQLRQVQPPIVANGHLLSPQLLRVLDPVGFENGLYEGHQD